MLTAFNQSVPIDSFETPAVQLKAQQELPCIVL